MRTYCNIKTLSFLIASFNEVINNFGSNKKSIDFYKNQMQNLVSIGQVDPNSAEIVNDLINFSYIGDSDKWKIEMSKIDFFMTMMDIIISNANDTETVESIILRAENNNVTQEKRKVLNIIRKVFYIKNRVPENYDMQRKSHFGTMKFTENTANVQRILKLAGDYDKVRIKNIRAVCSGDPIWIYLTLNKDFFVNNKELNNIFKDISNGAEIQVVKKVSVSDGCHDTYSSYNVNEKASEALRLFIMNTKGIKND